MFKYVTLHNSNIPSIFWLLLRVLIFLPVISKSLPILQPNWTALLSRKCPAFFDFTTVRKRGPADRILSFFTGPENALVPLSGSPYKQGSKSWVGGAVTNDCLKEGSVCLREVIKLTKKDFQNSIRAEIE